jgi:ABC-type sugar transport system ATPase subunit
VTEFEGAAQSAATLEATDMTKSYGPNVVLDSVTVRLTPGSITGLVGHNGAGKSTLLRCLSGAERPDHGQIVVGGVPVDFANPSDAMTAGVACVYQELSLVECLTVAQNVFLGSETSVRGVLAKRRMDSATRQLCAEFDIGVRPDDQVSKLSVAQRQLIEVAAAIRRDVRYLLLDEPTTALEPHQIDQLLRTVKNLAATRGLAVLLVNHKLDEVFAVADHVICLSNGTVVLDRPVDGLDRTDVVRAIVGRDIPLAESQGGRAGASKRPRSHATTGSGAPRLAVRHLSSTRLPDVTLTARAGEILGIYGLMGSGRSRFLRTLISDEPRGGGDVLLDGTPVRFKSIRESMNAGIAYVPEERKVSGFIPGFDSIDNVALPVLGRFERLGVVARSRVRQVARNELQKLSVRGSLSRPTSELSGGNQQKVLFGRAALQAPKVLLLDEPTKGVDIGAKAEIHAIIRRMAVEQAVAVILVSSEEEELLELADTICVFKSGSCDGVEYSPATIGPGVLRSLAWGDGAGKDGREASRTGGAENG